MRIDKPDRTLLITLLISAPLYYGILYQTPRHQFLQLMAFFLGLFALYFLALRQLRKTSGSESGFQVMIGAAILFRLVAIFALPELSDDYFRFIWDGRLLAHGVNPFAALPSSYSPESYAALGLSPELFEGLNSKSYFTIYPPVCQGIFLLSSWFFPSGIYGPVLGMKIFFFLAEGATLFFLVRLLQKLGLPRETAAIYALNPLVIVELCGNLHFEALMICFLLASVYLLIKGRWWASAIPFGLAICSKLLPVMFLPFLIRRIGWAKSIGFGAIAGGITLLGFLPIFDIETFLHLFESISLYFQSFEFNASIYYLVRAAGYQAVGYNIIGVAGKVLAALTFLGIVLMAILERDPKPGTFPSAMLWALVLYFLFASIVHPWYICPLVALCLFTHYRFPVIWTVLLPLTYVTYMTDAYQENLWFVAIEYLLVIGLMIFEWKRGKLKSLYSVV